MYFDRHLSCKLNRLYLTGVLFIDLRVINSQRLARTPSAMRTRLHPVGPKATMSSTLLHTTTHPTGPKAAMRMSLHPAGSKAEMLMRRGYVRRAKNPAGSRVALLMAIHTIVPKDAMSNTSYPTTSHPVGSNTAMSMSLHPAGPKAEMITHCG